ncbi:DUF4238 domain-containing protein [Nocardia sp. NPDC058058]|uniref:DUF4238 domain-containing protein n=1 Tax=Nocardia sp. NPDC058058 TaxID=3346317 RepID=UPI0036DB0702
MFGLRQFDHEWLSDDFVTESQRIAEGESAIEHHYVPQMYLRRWALNRQVQPVKVDESWIGKPKSPKSIAKEPDFYTLPSVGTTLDLPLRWIETHLGRIETKCSQRLDSVVAQGPGVVSDEATRRDLSVFLGLQVTRTPSAREHTLVVINMPDHLKRRILMGLYPGLSVAEVDQAMRHRQADATHEALDLMIKDVRNTLASDLIEREWAIYQTTGPVVTCDDPVVFVAGPRFPRSLSVRGESAAVLYPLDPAHLLVMLKPGLRHRGPYLLNKEETRSVNVEVVGAASKTAFERPGDGIVSSIHVSVRPEVVELDDEAIRRLDDAAVMQLFVRGAVPRSRWATADFPPDWPVPRWYNG